MINTSAQTALKNSVYNFIGFLLPIVVLIFITPIVISKLGIKEYGIFIFLNTILTFLGLLDLGISTATNKHVVEYYSTNQGDRLKRLLNSMNSIYLIQAFVYLFVCIIIGLIMQSFFIRPSTEVNYLLLLTIIGIIGFTGTFFANFNNTLVAIQRYDLHLKISSAFLLLSNISMLILAVLGYKLVPILISLFFIRLLSGLTYFLITRKVFVYLKLQYSWDKTELIKNYKFALPIAFNNLANSSLVHFDKLIIPIFYGGSMLTYYSVPGSIASKISDVSATFSSLLFPITVNLHTLNNLEKIKKVYTRSIRLITILSSALALSIIFTADKVLRYWLGPSFEAESTKVLIILVLTNFVLALFSPLSNLLMAMNKMKFLTIGSLIMAAINLMTLFIFLPKYGIVGAALSYLISVLFVFLMFNIAERKYFNIKKHTHFKLLAKIIATAIPFFVIVKLLLYPLIVNLLTLTIIGPVCVLLFMILYKIFGFVENEDWKDFKFFFLKFLKIKNISNTDNKLS